MKKFSIILLIFILFLTGCSNSQEEEVSLTPDLSFIEEYVKIIRGQDVYLLQNNSFATVFMITSSEYDKSKSAFSFKLEGTDAEYTVNRYFHRDDNFETDYCIAIVYGNINLQNVSFELYDNYYSAAIQDASLAMPIQDKSIDSVEEILKINGHYYLFNKISGYSESVNSLSQEFQLIALDGNSENIESCISYCLDENNDSPRHIDIVFISALEDSNIADHITAFEVTRYYDADITTNDFYDFRDKFLAAVDSIIITADNKTINYELYHK